MIQPDQEMINEAKPKKARKPRRSSRYIVLRQVVKTGSSSDNYSTICPGVHHEQVTQAETLKKAESNIKALDIEGEFVLVCIRKKFSIKEVKQMKLIIIPVKSIEQEKYEEAKKEVI